MAKKAKKAKKASKADKQTPKLYVEKNLFWGFSGYLHSKTLVDRPPMVWAKFGGEVYDSSWKIPPVTFQKFCDLRLKISSPVDEDAFVSVYSKGDVKEFLKQYANREPALMRFQEKQPALGRFFEHASSVKKYVQDWLSDKNEAGEDDLRLLDRLALLSALCSLVPLLEKFSDADSPLTPEDAAVYAFSLAEIGINIGRYLQVILDEEAELEAGKKKQEKRLKKIAKERDFKENIQPKREEIKKLAAAVSKELFRDSGGVLPMVKVVIARVRGSYAERGLDVPCPRTVSEDVDTELIAKACQ